MSPKHPSPATTWLSDARVRLLGALLALTAGAAAVVVVVDQIRSLAPLTPASSPTQPSPAGSATARGSTSATAATNSRSSSSASTFPAPPPGAVVLGAEDGANALGLAAVPRRGSTLLQASVISSTAVAGLAHLDVRFQVGGSRGATVAAASCGAGCYRATVAVPRPRVVSVLIEGHSPGRVTFHLPAAWPPPSASAIVERAGRVWRSLHSLVDQDDLSDGRVTLHTVWRIVAPDRVAYSITHGGDSIIIGDRSWTRPSGGLSWTERPQVPVQQPIPFWVSSVDARLLGTVSVGGRPAYEVSFFDPDTPGWYTILVDKQTMHTLQVHMIATDHFMTDAYSAFNDQIAITPPAASSSS
jgi:hypothetical protein